MNESSTGQDRILEAARAGGDVLGEEAAEGDAGRMSGIGVPGLSGRIGRKSEFGEGRAALC